MIPTPLPKLVRRSSSGLHPRAVRPCLLALLFAVMPSCVTDECPAVAPKKGKFTFRLINRSASPQYVGFGCGGDPPIEIDTPRGPLGIGLERADFCGNSCERVLRGVKPLSCSDCGGGSGITVQPGLSTDIEWDRRVWVPATMPASCSGLDKEAQCALSVAVDATLVTGRLVLSEVHPFTADLSLSAVDIGFQ
jgi:hypothetical protein